MIKIKSFSISSINRALYSLWCKLCNLSTRVTVLEEGGGGGGSIAVSGFENLSEAPTTIWDFSAINKASLLLTGNRILDLTNTVDGDTGLLQVIQDSVGGRTLTLTGEQETGMSLSGLANDVDVLGFININGILHWSVVNYGTIVPVNLSEAIDWTDEANTTDAGSGTINGLNTTTPAGARATKKLAANGYVEYNVGATASNSASLVLVLDDSNDTSYAFNAGNAFKIGLFHTSSIIYTNITNGATAAVNRGALGSYKWLRLQQDGNNVLIQASIDGAAYVTLATEVGILSGVANVYVKTIFATNSTAKSIVTARGVMQTI